MWLTGYLLTVLSELATSHIRVDVTKMKGEVDLVNKYIICEELGRYSSPFFTNLIYF